MTKKKRKYISLRTRVVRLTWAVSLVLILAGTLVGLVVYGYTCLKNYKTESQHLMDFCLSLEDKDYLEKLFKETREIYDNMPENVRTDISSEAFMNSFGPLLDDDFFAARDILVKCRENTDFRNIFLMFPDHDHSAIVYVLDGDEDEWAYMPGTRVDSETRSIEDVAESSWRMVMTHSDAYGWIGTDMKPIYNDDHQFIGYAAVDLDLNVLMYRILNFVLILAPIVLLLVAILGVSASGLVNKYITSHLMALENAAKEYTLRENVEINEDTPSVFAPLNINTGNELEDLWKSMVGMENDVKETMIRLREVTAREERINADLTIARQIQGGMLPQEFPEQNEYALYASMDPAREVGGDFYDFFMIDDNHIAMVIADVSGKGLPAALFMAISKALLKNRAQIGGTPSEILYDVNNQLCKDNKGKMFVTVWMAIIDIRTGKGLSINAGHEHPVLQRAGGSYELVTYRHSPMVAVFGGLKFKEREFVMYPGDRLFVYTDGVPEASDEESNLYGTERMVESLNRNKDMEIKDLLVHMKLDIDRYAGKAEQFDDITMLIFEYKGNGE